MSDLIRRNAGGQLPMLPQPGPPPESFHAPPEGRSIDLRQYLQLLLRRKWLVLATVLTVVFGTALQVYTATPLYTATARIQIDPESSNVLPYEDPFQSSIYFLATEAYLRTQAEILGSRALARRVVQKMRLDKDPVFNARTSAGIFSDWAASVGQVFRGVLLGGPDPAQPAQPDDGSTVVAGPEPVSEGDGLETWARTLQGSVTVDAVRGTRIMEISFTSADPALAAAVVNVMTEEYVQLNFDKRFDATRQATDFLTTKLDDLKKKVEESEEKLILYAKDNEIVNVDERQNIILAKLSSLNTELTEVESKLIAESARHDALRNASVENFPQSLKTQSILSLEARLLELNQNHAKLSATFGPVWPEVSRLQGEIEAVQRQIDTEKREALKQAREDYETIFGHYTKLQDAFTQQKSRANQFYQDSIQYNILKREVETNKDLYEGVLQRLKQAGVSAGLRSSNIHIVDDAQPPQFASWPSKRRNIFMGGLLGLFLGIALAFAVDYIDNTVKSPEDLEDFLGLPTLSVIPSLQESRRLALLPAKAEGDDGALMEQYLSLSKSQIWEAYRSLRTSILLSHSGSPPQVLLVTSALPGEGKTTTSLHTAMVLAQTGARTLLIDMDMRKPAVARLMGIDGNRGMSHYLSGNSDLSSQIQPGRVPNLFVLAAGPHPPNPAELIGSERMSNGLNLVRDYFKYVVIDSPPIMSVTDALILATLVDGVVLVVHGGTTPREAVRKASDRLASVGGRILGALINNVDIRKSEYSYYYRYYYYHDDYGADQSKRSRGA